MTHLPPRRLDLRFACACATIALVSGLVTPAGADVTPIGPFDGQFHDTFDQYTTNMAVLALPVLQGTGEIRILGENTSIKVEFSSSLGGDLVVPMSGMMMGQLGVADWVFTVPARRFGAWWENNSGASDATVEFYDAGNNPIGTAIASVPVAAQQWTWNGWHSDTPIARIRVTGNGLINGFIWYENVQLDAIPEPVVAPIVLGSVLIGNRRLRKLRR